MDCPDFISLISKFTLKADMQDMQDMQPTIYYSGPGVELGYSYCGRNR